MASDFTALLAIIARLTRGICETSESSIDDQLLMSNHRCDQNDDHDDQASAHHKLKEKLKSGRLVSVCKCDASATEKHHCRHHHSSSTPAACRLPVRLQSSSLPGWLAPTDNCGRHLWRWMALEHAKRATLTRSHCEEGKEDSNGQQAPIASSC